MAFLDLLSLHEKKLMQKNPIPSFIKPMLATLTDERFSDPDWIFERKLDGERCLLFKKGNTFTLKSRNDKILNQSYPEIIAALKELNLPDCILDGEIVALSKKATSFSLLSQRFGVTALNPALLKMRVYYYVFDILYCDRYLIAHLPLLTRKNILKSIIPQNKTICYVAHKKEHGEAYFKQ